MKVFLDTGVLGLATHPNAAQGRPVVEWMSALLAAGVEFVVPEICDYELRRKYLHLNSTAALAKLNDLVETLDFGCVDSPVWRDAASIWAQCRRTGSSLAPPDAIDGDVLLIATARRLPNSEQVVVATTNVKHLSSFLDARSWRDISSP